MPTNIILDVILTLLIFSIMFSAFKKTTNQAIKSLSIILIVIHIITIYLDYFSNAEIFKTIFNTTRFIITLFLAYKVSKKAKK